MIFNFSFDDSLDFTKFKKQSNHYLYVFKNKDIEYNLLVSNYKLTCKAHAMSSTLKVNQVDINSRLISIKILEVSKDKDGDIINGKIITPSSHILFKDIKQINELYQPYDNTGNYFANSTTEIVDFMCKTIKLLSKINKLSVFI